MLEIICTSLNDALLLESSGIKRIEVISHFDKGGLTPDPQLIKAILAQTRLEVYAMVRPHDHSFTYSDQDKDHIKTYIESFQNLGVKGLVLGTLNPANTLNKGLLSEFLSAISCNVTFHRAIDDSSNYLNDIKWLLDNPAITHVLTSGGPGKATNNVKQLVTVERQNPGSHPKLLVGSGVNTSVWSTLHSQLASRNYHLGTCVRPNNNPNTPICKHLLADHIAYYYKHIDKVL